MKKRILAALLALLLTTPALAVQEGNFVRTRTYTGQFSDLAADSVFYDNVAALYEYGLSVGKPDGTYGLQDPMTRGEIFIFAGRIRSLYRTGDPEAGPSGFGSEDSPLAFQYLAYLLSEQVVGAETSARFSDLTLPATRAEVAHVLANVLPAEELPLINDRIVTEAYASRRFLTDVTEATPYVQDILTLYRTGISLGSDGAGSFQPESPITRGAAAAMLTRLVDPALRVTPAWDLTNSARGTTLASLVEPGDHIAAPATAEELEQSVRYMLSGGSPQLALRYPGISAVQARQVMEQALRIVKSYCEQSYNSVSASFSSVGDVTLTFSAVGLTQDQVETYRQSAMEAAIAVHDQLWADGLLTQDMTELEKAYVYYTWICEHCVYDDDAGETSPSHLPYSLFANGLAVCDGYTGAYNLLLKLEGIDCYGLSNTGHIWTVASLDGTEYHIDTTWGDSGPTVNDAYFAMTAEEAWQEHPW